MAVCRNLWQTLAFFIDAPDHTLTNPSIDNSAEFKSSCCQMDNLL